MASKNGKTERRRRVAIIGTRGYPSYYGGFETAVRKLAPYLSDRDWEVTVFGRRGQVQLEDEARDERVISVFTPGIDSNSASTLSYGFSAVISATIRKPDVVLIMNVANGYWLPMLKLRGVPSVINVDGIEWHREKWGKFAKKIFRGGAALTARYGDELVFDANAIGDFWKREFDREGTFIPYGGDDPGALPVEPGLEDGSYVLVVARFVPENTILEFVTAARSLAQDYDVVIVGSAGAENHVQQQVRKLSEESDRVHWLGHISDDQRLNSLWQHAGAYFHGHSVGGTNPALVQAMACGAKIVARDTVYNREVLGDGGIFTMPSAAEIERNIRCMIDEKAMWPKYRSRVRERARSTYSWLAVNSAYEKILAEQVKASRQE